MKKRLFTTIHFLSTSIHLSLEEKDFLGCNSYSYNLIRNPIQLKYEKERLVSNWEDPGPIPAKDKSFFVHGFYLQIQAKHQCLKNSVGEKKDGTIFQKEEEADIYLPLSKRVTCET